MEDNKKDVGIKAESPPWSEKRPCVQGGILLFTPPHMNARRRPCVVLGQFSNGTPAVHFRQYSLQRPDFLAPTRDGISLTLAELEIVYERVAAVMASTVRIPSDGNSGGMSDAA